MTVPRTAAPARPGAVRIRSAVLQYLGMVVAMLVGMVVLDAARHLLAPDLAFRTDVETLVMATEMSVGMAVWMLIRRHGPRSIAVMCAAMYVPFLVLLPLHWAGALSGDALMSLGHVLMLPAMALAMPFAHRGHAAGHGADAVAR